MIQRRCDCWITKFGYCENVARFRVKWIVPPTSPHSDVYHMCAPCYDLAMASGEYVDIDQLAT
jgi:hypothetical protein